MARERARDTAGQLLRAWRVRRKLSQMDLALGVSVSPRHLSFVETGRSRPSPELVLAICIHLDVPLRDRNAILLAAGHAPRYSHLTLDDPAMAQVLASLQRMLDAHHPYPGVVIDRQWNVLLANSAAGALTAGLPAHLLGPPLNVYRVCLHPDGLAGRTTNFDEWSGYLLDQLRRSVQLFGDDELAALEAEVLQYPNVIAALANTPAEANDERPVLVPLRLRMGEAGPELSLFTTLTMFGSPRDVTLEEIAVELFFPADASTDEVLQRSS